MVDKFVIISILILALAGLQLVSFTSNSKIKIYKGQLAKSLNGEKVLLKLSEDEVIELNFVFDNAKDLIVEDLDYVVVRGYYSALSGKLTVEEIEPISMFVFLLRYTQRIYC